jgi:hypothetical protein
MRVVLTEVSERGHRTNPLVSSRLAANSQAPKLPQTHAARDTEKRGANHLIGPPILNTL